VGAAKASIGDGLDGVRAAAEGAAALDKLAG